MLRGHTCYLCGRRAKRLSKCGVCRWCYRRYPLTNYSGQQPQGKSSDEHLAALAERAAKELPVRVKGVPPPFAGYGEE